MKKYVEHGIIGLVGLNASSVLSDDNEDTIKKESLVSQRASNSAMRWRQHHCACL